MVESVSDLHTDYCAQWGVQQQRCVATEVTMEWEQRHLLTSKTPKEPPEKKLLQVRKYKGGSEKFCSTGNATLILLVLI